MKLSGFTLFGILALTSFAPAQEPPSYAKHIRPFFVKYCLECHNAKTEKRGLNLETYKSLQEGSDLGPVIAPGKPNESKLVQLLEAPADKRMPPKTAKRHPAKDEIAKVRAWVAAGAKDDSGLIKVVIPQIKPHQPLLGPVTALAYQPFGEILAVARDNSGFLVNPHTRQLLDKPIQEVKDAKITAVALVRPDILVVASGKPGRYGGVSFFPVEADASRKPWSTE